MDRSKEKENLLVTMAIDTKDTGRMAGSMGKELRHKKTEIRFMPLGKKTCLMEMAMS